MTTAPKTPQQSLSILLRNASQHEWAAVCNTGTITGPILNDFLDAVARVDTVV